MMREIRMLVVYTLLGWLSGWLSGHFERLAHRTEGAVCLACSTQVVICFERWIYFA